MRHLWQFGSVVGSDICIAKPRVEFNGKMIKGDVFEPFWVTPTLNKASTSLDPFYKQRQLKVRFHRSISIIGLQIDRPYWFFSLSAVLLRR
jgi:hypothetical protein